MGRWGAAWSRWEWGRLEGNISKDEKCLLTSSKRLGTTGLSSLSSHKPTRFIRRCYHDHVDHISEDPGAVGP